jgi:hypothetical protein
LSLVEFLSLGLLVVLFFFLCPDLLVACQVRFLSCSQAAGSQVLSISTCLPYMLSQCGSSNHCFVFLCQADLIFSLDFQRFPWILPSWLCFRFLICFCAAAPAWSFLVHAPVPGLTGGRQLVPKNLFFPPCAARACILADAAALVLFAYCLRLAAVWRPPIRLTESTRSWFSVA